MTNVCLLFDCITNDGHKIYENWIATFFHLVNIPFHLFCDIVIAKCTDTVQIKSSLCMSEFETKTISLSTDNGCSIQTKY